MAKLKKIIFSAAFIFIYNYSHSQELPQSAVEKVSNNIIAYHIRYALSSDLGLDSSGAMFSSSNRKVLELMPEKNKKLQLTVTPFEAINYPLEGWKLYSIYKRSFNLIGDSLALNLSLFSFDFDDQYLIAFRAKDSCIKYISGNFFNSTIFGDYSLSQTNPSSWIQFVQLKSHYLLPKNISFVNEMSEWVKYAAYSNVAKQNIYIFINKKDPDIIKISLDAISKSTIKTKPR